MTGALHSLVLGTAGHVDHGKTALVRALSGVDTDRLPEEKARGVTIDLGFAPLELPGPTHYSIIDVPGHHAFVRNMLAGAGGIDCVMLVVAADDGPMPQTSEHLNICSLLGVEQGLVVLTKVDLATPEQLAETRRRVEQVVAQTFLAGPPMVPVSARSGAGLAELRQALVALAGRVQRPSAQAVLRLPIDRAFAVKGFGTVVTGTLHAGSVNVGNHLEVQPGRRAVRVRGLQMHNRSLTEAHAPTRLALNLSGVEVAELERGDMLVVPGTVEPASLVDVEWIALPEQPLPRHRALLRAHAFAAETMAAVSLYEGQPPLARLKLAKPLPLLPGDRLVLRQPSPASTVAGARVVDAHPLPRLRKSKTRSWLVQLRGSPEEQMAARVERRGLEGIGAEALAREMGWLNDVLRTHLQPLLAAGRVLMQDDHLLAPEVLAELAARVKVHAGRAKGAAITRAEVQTAHRLSAPVAALLWSALARDPALVVSSTHMGVRGAAEPAANPMLSRAETLYREAGLHAPIVSEAAAKLKLPAPALPALLTQLLRTGKLVRLGSDQLLVHAEALAALREKLKQHRGEQWDVARFKAFTGLSRKHAIPLLEYLDGVRATRNSNGLRTIL